MRTTLLLLILALGIGGIYLLNILNSGKKKREAYELRNAGLIYENKQLQMELGKNVAKANCMTCHGFKYKTENYLQGVVQWLGPNYLKLYLTKQDSLIKAKDSIAIILKSKFGNMANSHNFKFTDREFDALIEFMR